MTSLIQRQLEIIKQGTMELEKEHLKLQIELEKEMEKFRILEMEETIEKLDLLVKKLSENISGEILPNNIQIVYHQMKKEFDKDLEEFIKLQQNKLLNQTDIEAKRSSLRQREIDLRKQRERSIIDNLMQFNDNEKFITLEKFKSNISKVDQETLTGGPSYKDKWPKNLIEIKPEIKIYDEIVPIFNTLIGVITKQQQEIDMLKTKVFD